MTTRTDFYRAFAEAFGSETAQRATDVARLLHDYLARRCPACQLVNLTAEEPVMCTDCLIDLPCGRVQ